MEKDLISILIPVYNRIEFIAETLKSAQKQSYSNIEIIVSDNCSTDGTWEILTEFAMKDKRIKLLRTEENIGPVRNWLNCLKNANGEYIKILFSDDLISENFIEETHKIIANNLDVGFVLSKTIIRLLDKDKKNNKDKICNYSFLKREQIFIKRKSYIFQKLFNLKFPNSPGCSLLRKKDLENSLLIDIPNPKNLDFSNYGAGNDLLIYLLTAMNYPKIAVTNKAYSIFHGHKQSFTTSNKLATYYLHAKFYFCDRYNFMFTKHILKLFHLYIKLRAR